MAARNGDAKLAALEKALASPATLPDLQAKHGQSKKLGLSEIAARFAVMVLGEGLNVSFVL
jgi:hypothetical protein